MKRLVTICILLAVTTFPSCFEETGLKGLPPFTTNGENTIGCNANGRIIYNEYEESIEALWNQDDERLTIDAWFWDGSNLYISLYIPDRSVRHFTIDSTDIMTPPTTPAEDSIQNRTIRFAEFNTKEYDCKYLAGGNDPQRADVGNSMTLDLTRFDVSGTTGVLSGTFELSFKATKTCTYFNVTEGRFDTMMGPRPEIGPF